MTRTTTLAAGALLLMSSTSAFALEGKALFDRIVAETPGTVTVGNVEELDGDTVNVTDLKITNEDGGTASYATVTFDGLREEGDRVAIAESTGTDAEFTFSVQSPEGAKTGTLKAASGTASEVIAPASAILALMPERQTGRFELAGYTLSDLEGDFNGDGTFETKMTRIALTDLNSPLDFRYDITAEDKPEGPAPEPLTLGELSFEGTVVTPPDGGTVKIGDTKLVNLNVPASIDAPATAWFDLYDSFTMGATSFERDGKVPFKFDSLEAQVSPPDSGGGFKTTSTMNGMAVDLSAAMPPQQFAVAQQLGYETVTGKITTEQSYDPAAGRIRTDDFTVAFDDVASFSLGIDLTGYTPELASKLQQVQLEQAAAAQRGEQPNPMAAMELLSDLKLESFTMELKDDSITGKVLPLVASQMKTTPEQLAAGAPMFVGMGMAQLGTPDFTQQVAAAVGQFLQNPGTLSLKADPMQPVPVSEIIGLAQQPPKLIERLGVSVQATQ